MERAVSNTSNHGNLPPSLSSSFPAWDAPHESHVTSYTHQPQSTSTRGQAPLHPINELSALISNGMVEYNNPADFINTFDELSSPSSLSLPPSRNSQQLQIPLTRDSQWSLPQDGSISPTTPALMTPVTMSSSTMSRQSSFNPFIDEVSMLRVHSDSSSIFQSVLAPEDGPLVSYSPLVDAKDISACAEPSQFPTSFTGLANEVFPSPVHFSPSVSSHALGLSSLQQSDLAEDMTRSTSTLSASSESDASYASASSTCSRQSQRNREINAQAASRKIAPKAIDINDEAQSAASNIQMKRVVSEDGSSKDFARIAKTPYIRPQHPRMMCPYCKQRPQGFRGTHELDRHIARSHAEKRKGYICVDASADGKWLSSKCKHCRTGKVYGAYYNAAAHLRRTHFHPRKRGRKGKNDEKRGGIGGGDDPPMDYLKQHWIQEVDVPTDAKPSKRSKQQRSSPSVEDSEDSPFDLDMDVDVDVDAEAEADADADNDDECHNTDNSLVSQSTVSNVLEYDQFIDPNVFMNPAAGSMQHFAAYNDATLSMSISNFDNFQFDAYVGS